MKRLRIYVVVDTETNKALAAFRSEEEAMDWEDEHWVATQRDTLISPCMADLEEGE